MSNLQDTTYIIIPVHNRKLTTLKCLQTLKSNGDLDLYNVVVVDDGSTDGTSEAITEKYPDVIILKGDGNLWWGGAIEKGMQYVYQQDAKYLIWLNDDCYPTTGAIEGLIKLCQHHPKAIVGAQCIDPDTLTPSYGGLLLKYLKLQGISTHLGTHIECDALNGNLVCLPREVIDDIGYPDSRRLPHHYSDFVYIWKAKKSGYKIIISHYEKVYCKNEKINVAWLVSSKRLLFNIFLDYFNRTSYYYWKISLRAYYDLFGFKGIPLYVCNRIIKFSIALLIVFILPISIRKRKIKT